MNELISQRTFTRGVAYYYFLFSIHGYSSNSLAENLTYLFRA
jgi:hypothetical protein